MKCTKCEQYHVSLDCDGDPIVICDDGGDVSNPDEDIMCQSAGDKEEDYETISETQKASDVLTLKQSAKSSQPFRTLLESDICDWCCERKATITDGTYAYCTEAHQNAFLENIQQAIKEASKNRPQYVLFDPVAVGWDVGLDKAIENAQKMHVPLAVESQEHLKRIRKRYPYVCVGILER